MDHIKFNSPDAYFIDSRHCKCVSSFQVEFRHMQKTSLEHLSIQLEDAFIYEFKFYEYINILFVSIHMVILTLLHVYH
jgi:hypothetical protein